MADIESLKTVHTIIKTSFDSIKKYVDEFREGSNVNQLVVRKQKLVERIHEWETNYIELNRIEPGVYTNVFEEYSELYYTVMADIQSLVEGKNKVKIEVTSNTSVDVKLPDIVLPRFNGDFAEWTAFIDIYNSLIHTNTKLSPVQKLHYLKSALIDSASKVISSLKLTNENYDIAYDLIFKTYNNKFLIINSHLSAIDNIASVGKGSRENLRVFLNNARQQVQALAALFEPVIHWDIILLHVLAKKLDNSTRVAWNLSQTSGDLPTLNSFFNFIEMRVFALENSNCEVKTSTPKTVSTIVEVASQPCFCCKEEHPLYKCPRFKAMNVQQRKEFVSKNSICSRCIASRHSSSKCKFRYCCNKCKEKHNVLLHEDVSPAADNILMTHSSPRTLLSTVSLNVFDANGRKHRARALLDSGSQINLMTTSLAHLLGLPLDSSVHNLSVLQGYSMSSNKSAKVKINSNMGGFDRTIQCVVIDKIAQNLPSSPIDHDHWKIPDHVTLADPHFYIPCPVDMLLGAELYFDVLQQGCIRLGKGLPILRDSRFGWLISGVCDGDRNPSVHVGLISNDELHKCLSKFWQIEEIAANDVLTGSDKCCEDYFVSNVKRIENGKFEVALPFIDDKIGLLGTSFIQARNRFQNLERRLARSKILAQAYSKFINDYVDLGHAQVTDLKGDELGNNFYFLPHHPVLKDNNTSKIRVVFDASAKSSSGYSLNNIMHTGPKLQQDLLSILIRFRCHLFVFVADIIKMYRQIRVRACDSNFQLIVWRDTPQQDLKIIRLNTVTYGTSCAPYLAMRCIKMLAEEGCKTYPRASQALRKDCYVDDIITGASSEAELAELQKEVCQLLMSGGFELHKWSSNCKAILEDIPQGKQNCSTADFSEEKDVVKTLGLSWHPLKDVFKISYSKLPTTGQDTKRSILSAIAHIYDPVGIISPITLSAKLIMQELWRSKLDWEDVLPKDLQDRWNDLRNNLVCLEELMVPRCLFKESPTNVQLHGFSDASLKAYGACIYIRATYIDGSRSCRLLCSKSKVAPLKNVTLPRLELLGAVLLAKLYHFVSENLTVTINESFLWSDSSIVLAWLHLEPSQLKMFVGNRVSKILDLTPAVMWRHVSGEDNPADIVSRGVRAPSELLGHRLWWNGPSWLCEQSEQWPNKFSKPIVDSLPERRVVCTIVNGSSDRILPSVPLADLFSRVSKFSKLVRIVAYCLRWVKNHRLTVAKGPMNALSPHELKVATSRIFLLIQQEAFSITCEEEMTPSKITSLKLQALNPFLDSDGLLRVGGRLENADIPFAQKHPIILPDKHTLIESFLRMEHERLLHAGTQNVLANIRLRYWPINGRSNIKRIIHGCIKCARFKAANIEQLMGSLPKDRVTKHRPFEVVGIDFAGPIIIRSSRLRKAPRTKAYIALFVCMSTKAIHIELVSSLSTDAFLAALRRFITRRGCCSIIYSDNGRNFVGARNQLRDLYKYFNLDISKQKLITTAAQLGIVWKFTPSYAPHFGGLWEGSIKIMKYHIRRVLGSHCLTFEEYLTVLNQIEAILNSRPLLALTDDSSDISYISPGHFLIGQPLTTLPEPYINKPNVGMLKLFKQMIAMRDQFWSVWSKDYLNNLQKRNKWSNLRPNINTDAIVLIKEDNIPPLHWHIGRIVETKPGRDGNVRVVVIKTNTGTYTRPISKVVPLPCSN